MTTTTETIPDWKRAEVDALVELLEGAETVGIVTVAGIPSRQLQVMRRDLHGTTQLRMSRNTLIARALQQVDDGLEDLLEYIGGPIGLVVTESNPFSLYRHLEASKTPAPIGAGEVAPNDIVIEAGDTGIDPGPFVGDLQNAGVPSRIDQGSIQVMETTTVCAAGEEVSQDLEGVLNELEMEPKEVGLDLQAVFADGVVFHAADLEIDVEDYRARFAGAAADARGLAIEVGFPAPAVAGALLSRADAQARSLAVAAGIVEPDTAGTVFSTGVAEGRALATSIDDEAAVPADALPDAPAPPAGAEPTDEQADDDTEDAAADEASTDEPDEGDDEDASAEGLGDLFG